jgi:hypothetical protein
MEVNVELSKAWLLVNSHPAQEFSARSGIITTLGNSQHARELSLR